MPITKSITKNGKTLGYHEVNTVSLSFTPMGTMATIVVVSWEDVSARVDNEGRNGISWYPQCSSPCSDWTNIAQVETTLTLDGDLKDGVLTAAPTPADPLALAKARKWSQIKARREYETVQPLPTPYGTFDANNASQKRITDAIMLLKTLSDMGTPTTVNFVLADNSTVTLNLEQMTNVGLLLGQRVQGCINKGAALRLLIEGAVTVEDVESVSWD